MQLMDFSISSKGNVSASQATFFEMRSAWSASFLADVLACAAAGVIAVLPGALRIKVRTSIVASGAIGIFVLVYFSSTPLIRTLHTPLTEDCFRTPALA